MASVVQRTRMENKERNYFNNLYDKYGGIPENHAEAISMRMKFFDKYILQRVS